MAAVLNHLRIKNLALVEELQWQVKAGFIAVTGETGAGKSMIVGALQLLLGERADKSLIRTGAELCTVEGVFNGDDLTRFNAQLEESGIESCDAELVCQLLRKVRAANPGKRLLLVLDNARYQRATLVQLLAKRLRIRLLFLPPYSPNLNLIERFWKFLRKQVMRNTYYATFAEFRAAIQRVLTNLDTYAEELTTLMTEKFHLFGST